MVEGNLVFSQKEGDDEAAVIDLRAHGLGLIVVTVTEVRGQKARIGYRALRSIPIHRKSIFERPYSSDRYTQLRESSRELAESIEESSFEAKQKQARRDERLRKVWGKEDEGPGPVG